MADSHKTLNMYPNLIATPLIAAPLDVPLSATSLSAAPLNDQQHFRLNKINEIKDYFATEIKERELTSKRLSKYIASFDYFDKSLIVLFVTAGSISIPSSATVTGASVGITSASFSLAFSICTGIVKKLLTKTRSKKKKQNKIVMLARSKLNSIGSKISEALINNETSHEDSMTIINEKKKYRELKESLRMMKSQRSDVDKINLMKEGKKIAINEVINSSLKP